MYKHTPRNPLCQHLIRLLEFVGWIGPVGLISAARAAVNRFIESTESIESAGFFES